MISYPPRFTRTDPPFPSTTLFRSFFDEAGQVVEVDAADDARGVGDVAAEQRHFVITVAPVVADAQAALERGLAAELGRLVQEEVHLAAVRPVGVDEEL